MKQTLIKLTVIFAFICLPSVFANTISLNITNEKNKQIVANIPLNPQRIVCLNYITVDILDSLGLGDRIVGMIKSGSVPQHLEKYANNKNIANVGSMKDLDMEKIMSLEPDIIFSSDRTVRNYKEFLMIAPTVASYIDYKKGFFEGFKYNLEKHGKIFQKENEVKDILAGFDKRLNELKIQAKDKTAVLGIFVGGSLKVLGDHGRVSIITTDIGFDNIAAKLNVNHGNTVSYEFFVKENPEYIFILDKDQAVGTKSNSAKQLLDNELIKQTRAYKENKIVFLEPGNVWYQADGGIQSMNIILKNIESIKKE